MCRSVEDFSDGAERLLSCSVPNLQLHVCVFDLDATGAEIDANCDVMLRVEHIFGESRQNTRLAHAYTTKIRQRAEQANITRQSKRRDGESNGQSKGVREPLET